MAIKNRMPSKTTTWITPKNIIDHLGPFDLDPCAHTVMPWATATTMLTIEDDGLSRPWDGFVWCNPPYGTGNIEPWLRRMYEHRNGIGLYPASTETIWFQDLVLPCATAILWVRGRVSFCDDGGRQQAGNTTGSVIAAYGEEAADRVGGCLLEGWVTSCPL